VVRTFSVADAKQAGLWQRRGANGQPTPWVTYPQRMLRARALGLALRDVFADVLMGLMIYEELVGSRGPEPTPEPTPAPRAPDGIDPVLEAALAVEPPPAVRQEPVEPVEPDPDPEPEQVSPASSDAIRVEAPAPAPPAPAPRSALERAREKAAAQSSGPPKLVYDPDTMDVCPGCLRSTRLIGELGQGHKHDCAVIRS
jgi:hypothetical protein